MTVGLQLLAEKKRRRKQNKKTGKTKLKMNESHITHVLNEIRQASV